MKTTQRLLAVLGCLMLGATAPRALESGPYTMEILVGGVPVREYAARGTTYVEARRERDYAIRLANRTGERVAVALAVDGLNSIDARKTSAVAGRKWILGPWECVTLEGWQTTGATARRFVFTTEKESYGAWLGRTDDLGIVSAVFFREKRPVWREEWEVSAYGTPSPGSANEPSSAAPRSSKAERQGAARRSDAAERSDTAKQKSVLSDNAATGIGDEISHPVRTVEFEPEADPAAALRIRYEYRDALVRLGVVPRPRRDGEDALARREQARGFAGEGFAPDPYRRPR